MLGYVVTIYDSAHIRFYFVFVVAIVLRQTKLEFGINADTILLPNEIGELHFCSLSYGWFRNSAVYHLI